MPDQEDPLLTTAEALARLGVHRTTLHRWIATGELHPIRKRPGVRKQPLYFRASEIEAILRSRPASPEFGADAES
jgi:excisionase family DNA binding protein